MPAPRTAPRHRIRAPQIERETGLLPIAAARQVIGEVSLWLGVPLHGRYATRLAFQARRIYVHSASFRVKLRRPGDRGRDTLYVFMRHWLAARFHEERPDLYRRLPAELARGAELPACPPAPNAAPSHPATSHGFNGLW
jgi:hypothetical protein